ncbi:hypothetical protein M569_04002, partial [Genlisea aurea]
SNRVKKPPAAGVSDAPAEDSLSKNYVTEFLPSEAPPIDLKIKSIPPIPDQWRPIKRLKNLPNLPPISQAGVADGTLVFELDPGSNPDPSDSSVTYGLNLRQPSAGVVAAASRETLTEMELKKLREDLERLPDDMGMDQFNDVPVDGFGAAVMAGYGWKEGMGIGRNAKEDVKVSEVARKKGRGGLGFTEEPLENAVKTDARLGDKLAAVAVEPVNQEEGKSFSVGKKVRIVNGSKMGMKGTIVEMRKGDIFVIRTSDSNEKVKVQSIDVAEIGSIKEEQCMKKLKELKIKEEKDDKKDDDPNKARSVRVKWLRNHIRVRIISKELKKGRLFLKKGVVVDVVGPGLCDILMDESRELIQDVEQEFLETALPKRGGPVLVLYGKYKDVYGSLVERDLEKERGTVQDADTRELLSVKLEQIAEYTGDPSEIGY